MNLQPSTDEIVKHTLTSSVNRAAILERERQTTITKGNRRILARRFPRAFFKWEVQKKPLMIGIFHEIFKTDITLLRNRYEIENGVVPGLYRLQSRIGSAIGNYVGGQTYLRNVIEGAPRIDLDGNPSGQIVTKEEAEFALNHLQSLDALYGPSVYGGSHG